MTAAGVNVTSGCIAITVLTGYGLLHVREALQPAE
jgi:hypothetical protein